MQTDEQRGSPICLSLRLLTPVAENLRRNTLKLSTEEVVHNEVNVVVVGERWLNQELLIFCLLVEEEIDVILRCEEEEVLWHVCQWNKLDIACSFKSALIVALIVWQRTMVDLICFGIHMIGLVGHKEFELL